MHIVPPFFCAIAIRKVYNNNTKNGYQEAVTLLIAVIFYNHELIISN